MKKLLAVFLALMMVIAMMGFAAAEAGTFTGVGDGKNGAGTIEVEVDVNEEGTVTDVRVTKNGDDAGISDAAVNTIPALIVELQSANIDTLTGATLTQNGIRMAVLDAIKKAGLDEAAWSELKAPAAEKSEDVEATYDVVVIGGGGAGLTASIRAAQAGAKVILIEKMAALGGNTMIAGQGFNAADPERQSKMEMNDSLRKELESYLDLKPEDVGDFAYRPGRHHHFPGPGPDRRLRAQRGRCPGLGGEHRRGMGRDDLHDPWRDVAPVPRPDERQHHPDPGEGCPGRRRGNHAEHQGYRDHAAGWTRCGRQG